MAKGLTKRQEAVFRFIVEAIRDRGLPPTIAEIGEEFGISSTNGVNDHLVALEKKGYIERSSKARGIHVAAKGATGLYQPQPEPIDAYLIPLVGAVAAGSPILAEENVEEQLAISPALVRNATYCLRVRGESMIEDGILDGDIVIVDQGKQPRVGDIVVALVEDEATIKHFHPNGPIIELRPANASMESIMVPADSVVVQGVVVGLQRSF